MPLSIQFELSDDDLKYFKNTLKTARSTRASESEEVIISKAEGLLTSLADSKKISPFIAQRFQQLNVLISMLKDDDWKLPAKEKSKVLNILAYFINNYDLIPDTTPGIGYLDEAILVDLTVQKLIDEYKNYLQFANYKTLEEKVHHSAHPSREEWEEHNRVAMYQRMRNRQGVANLFSPNKNIDIF